MDSGWLGREGDTPFACDPRKVQDGFTPIPFPALRQSKALLLKRTLHAPTEWKGRRVVLRFNYVNYETNVYVNGTLAGSHSSGYGVFDIDIGEFLKFGQENDIRICVSCPPKLPNGLIADCVGFTGDYIIGVFGGIGLAVTDTNYINDVFLQPSISRKRLVGLETGLRHSR
jgi:hypothetical protein